MSVIPFPTPPEPAPEDEPFLRRGEETVSSREVVLALAGYVAEQALDTGVWPEDMTLQKVLDHQVATGDLTAWQRGRSQTEIDVHLYEAWCLASELFGESFPIVRW